MVEHLVDTWYRDDLHVVGNHPFDRAAVQAKIADPPAFEGSSQGMLQPIKWMSYRFLSDPRHLGRSMSP